MQSNQTRDVRERFSRIRISKAVAITILFLFLSSAFIVTGYNKLSGPNAEILTFYILYAVPFLIYLYTIKKYDLTVTAIFEGALADLKQVWFFVPLIIMTFGVIWTTILLLDLVSQDLATGYFNWLNRYEPFEIGPETTFLQYGLIFFVVAVFAPVVEEIIFRGIMVERFGAKYGYKSGVLISSLLFGVLHMDIIGAFVFGLVLSILYLRTRSLLLPFFIHAANNGAVVLLVFFDDYVNLDSMDTIEFYSENIWIGILLFVSSFAWLIWFLKDNWKIVHQVDPFTLKTNEDIGDIDR
jgi:membrane protease YdiL (CAAX protease family)